ncbi:MAG: hypothetical protein GX569_12435 [Candidatus Riflebacteria bacterium]|nr:hypothetical protein [Candidatus Riflebacteria bacterium]
MGELDLKIPQVRGLAFYPGCLEKGQRSEKALKAAVAEMYLNGVSTRKVSQITEYLCGFDISSSQVSKVTQELDLEVKTFHSRPLEAFPVVFLDARYEKVRHGGHIKNMAVLWAVGIDTFGKRHVLGLSCKLSEAEIHWREFLSSLIERGLKGVQMIVSDAHEGLAKARSKSNLRLIDGQEFVDIILRYYEQMDSRYKGIIPLKKVFVPQPIDDKED